MKVCLPSPLCDIGLTAASDFEILVYGGWNIHSVDTVYKLTNDEELNLMLLEPTTTDLPKPDFFIVNGTEINSQLFPHIKLIKGHQTII